MNRIDEFFRRKLSVHVETANQRDVDEMSKLLDEQSGKKRTIFFWFILLLLLSGGSFAWYSFGNKSAATSNNTISEQEVTGQLNSTNSNADSTSLYNKIFSTFASVSENKTLQRNTSVSFQTPRDNITETNNLLESNLSSSASQTRINKEKSTSEKVNQRNRSSSSKTQSRDFKKPFGQSDDATSPTDIEDDKEHLLKNEFYANNLGPILPITNLRFTIKEDTITLLSPTKLPNDTSETPISSPLKWSIRAGAGIASFKLLSGLTLTDKNYESTKQAFGSTFQFSVVRHFKNWEFGTGLQYSRFQRPNFNDTISTIKNYFYETPEIYIEENYSYPELYEKLNSYTGVYFMQTLSVPLQVGYNFCSSSRLHIIPAIQLNINLVQHEQIDFLPGAFEYYISTPEYVTGLYELWHVPRTRGKSSITLGATAAIEARYTISRRFYISGLIGASWLSGKVDERIPTSQYITSFGQALLGFRF